MGKIKYNMRNIMTGKIMKKSSRYLVPLFPVTESVGMIIWLVLYVDFFSKYVEFLVKN